MVEKQLVLVVGMHRSGTSATAHVLAGLGVAFGDNLMPPADDNPLGFQEDLSFVALNEELVGPAHGWYSIHNRSHENHTAGWDKRAKEWWDVFKSAQKPTHIGLKDPRICRSLPFWKDVFEKDIKAVHIVRNPLAVAESLRKRNDFDVQFSLALWFVYNFEAWSYLTRYKYETLTIDYDKLVDSEEETRSKIKSFLSLDEQLEVNAGIEKTLRHNFDLDSEDFEIFSLCEALYTRLLDGSPDIGTEFEPYYNHLVSRYKVFDRKTVESFDKRRAINDLSHRLKEAAKKNSEMNGVLSDEKESLEKRLEQQKKYYEVAFAEKEERVEYLENLTKDILSSRSWLITSPLRKIANNLRLIKKNL